MSACAAAMGTWDPQGDMLLAQWIDAAVPRENIYCDSLQWRELNPWLHPRIQAVPSMQTITQAETKGLARLLHYLSSAATDAEREIFVSLATKAATSPGQLDDGGLDAVIARVSVIRPTSHVHDSNAYMTPPPETGASTSTYTSPAGSGDETTLGASLSTSAASTRADDPASTCKPSTSVPLPTPKMRGHSGGVQKLSVEQHSEHTVGWRKKEARHKEHVRHGGDVVMFGAGVGRDPQQDVEMVADRETMTGEGKADMSSREAGEDGEGTECNPYGDADDELEGESDSEAGHGQEDEDADYHPDEEDTSDEDTEMAPLKSQLVAAAGQPGGDGVPSPCGCGNASHANASSCNRGGGHASLRRVEDEVMQAAHEGRLAPSPAESVSPPAPSTPQRSDEPGSGESEVLGLRSTGPPVRQPTSGSGKSKANRPGLATARQRKQAQLVKEALESQGPSLSEPAFRTGNEAEARGFLVLMSESPLLQPGSPLGQQWIESFRTLSQGELRRDYDKLLSVADLRSLVLVVERLDHVSSCSEFLTSLSLIQFAAKVHSVQAKSMEPGPGRSRARRMKTLTQIHAESKFPTHFDYTKFARMVAKGNKLMTVAAAGSFHLLLVLAETKKTARFLTLKNNCVIALANEIRYPDRSWVAGDHASGNSYHPVLDCLIPGIKHLREQLPLELGTMFSHHQRHTYGLKEYIDCGDLEACDGFFKRFCVLTFAITSRDTEAWSDLLVPCSKPPTKLHVMTGLLTFTSPATDPDDNSDSLPPRAPSPMSDIDDDDSQASAYDPSACRLKSPPDGDFGVHGACEVHTNFVAVRTPFRLAAPGNAEEPYVLQLKADIAAGKACAPQGLTAEQRKNQQRVYREDATGRFRDYAQNALRPETMEGAAAMLRDMFDDEGVKKDAAGYVHIGSELFAEKEVLFLDIDGNLAATIVATLPSRVRDAVYDKLTAVLNCVLACSQQARTRDSVQEAIGHIFTAMHFQSGYSRNMPPGKKEYDHLNPFFMKRRLLLQQLVPYASKEITNNPQLFDDLSIVLEDVFHHVDHTMKRHYPGIYHELSVTAEALPMREDCPAHPFTGFVLNINVVTKAHRDKQDKKVCLVIAIGRFTGGAICLHELGLVIPLRQGDCVMFPSGKITHYNLHYFGSRLSVVLHSDGTASHQWLVNFNNWGENEHFLNAANGENPSADNALKVAEDIGDNTNSVSATCNGDDAEQSAERERPEEQMVLSPMSVANDNSNAKEQAIVDHSASQTNNNSKADDQAMIDDSTNQRAPDACVGENRGCNGNERIQDGGVAEAGEAITERVEEHVPVRVTAQQRKLTKKTLLKATAGELIDEISRLRDVTLREVDVDFEDEPPVIMISSDEEEDKNDPADDPDELRSRMVAAMGSIAWPGEKTVAGEIKALVMLTLIRDGTTYYLPAVEVEVYTISLRHRNIEVAELLEALMMSPLALELLMDGVDKLQVATSPNRVEAPEGKINSAKVDMHGLFSEAVDRDHDEGRKVVWPVRYGIPPTWDDPRLAGYDLNVLSTVYLLYLFDWEEEPDHDVPMDLSDETLEADFTELDPVVHAAPNPVVHAAPNPVVHAAPNPVVQVVHAAPVVHAVLPVVHANPDPVINNPPAVNYAAAANPFAQAVPNPLLAVNAGAPPIVNVNNGGADDNTEALRADVLAGLERQFSNIRAMLRQWEANSGYCTGYKAYLVGRTVIYVVKKTKCPAVNPATLKGWVQEWVCPNINSNTLQCKVTMVRNVDKLLALSPGPEKAVPPGVHGTILQIIRVWKSTSDTEALAANTGASTRKEITENFVRNWLAKLVKLLSTAKVV
ncbi:hypothetical protein EIP91_011029 [Steccherinum ochraceum]|uniref:Uncharacterized protein n=1 Tax=Steccherinum ochraceum TaxID=92696 RepID=A0A4R0R7S7_9APHY|nr:hypothetical protein EIP91_011029 [Steccherinum ochraceum]